MSESISHLVEQLQNATSTDDVEKIVNAIVQFGEAAVPVVLEYAPGRFNATKELRFLTIFQRMDYPANRGALKHMVVMACNIDAGPPGDLATAMLKDIGAPAIPEIREEFKLLAQDYYENRFEFQGLCLLLQEMGSPVIDPLVPELLNLLEFGTDDNFVDEYAIWPLCEIGSPVADDAIPLLCNRIVSDRAERIKKKCINALEQFDLLAIKLRAPDLRQCLLDSPAEIRVEAQRLLENIGQF